MKFLRVGTLLVLYLLNTFNAEPYQPGNAGGAWTPSQAEIIRDKLVLLWKKKSFYIEKIIDTVFKDKDGDLHEERNSKAEPAYTDYFYDPEVQLSYNLHGRRLSTVDCKDKKEDLCRTYWSSKRMGDLAFTETKAIRLAFHDCIPYKNENGDGTHGGCDGCINFDENVVHNNVLQPSIALLVRYFLLNTYSL